MDGVTEAKALVKRAYEGEGILPLPSQIMVWCRLSRRQTIALMRGGYVPKDSDFKVLYGMEAYLVDDLKGMVTNPKKQSLDGRFVVFDIETTGFSPPYL